MIRHTDKNGATFYSLYAHLSKLDVKVNQRVKSGQIIGKEGGDPGKDPNPGYSTGHHLHFEIRSPTDSSQDKIDPYSFFFD